MILFAMKQRCETTLDRDEPVRVGADRDSVRAAAELAACVKGRAVGLRLVVGAFLSAEPETNRVEARRRRCDTGVA